MKRIMSICVVGLLVLGVISEANATEPTPAVPPQKSLPKDATASGRFVLYFSPHARADVYLVDTQTGQIWKPITYTDVEGKPEVWMPQIRFDTMEQFWAWVATVSKKSDAAK